jgi:hypothetical protein
MIFLTGCPKTLPIAPIRTYWHSHNGFSVPVCEIDCYDYNLIDIVDDKKCGENFKSGFYPASACHRTTGPDLRLMANELIPKALYNIEYYQEKELK